MREIKTYRTSKRPVATGTSVNDFTDPHDPKLNADTSYGFVFNGVHFERHSEGSEGIRVYISSKSDEKMIWVAPDGKIFLEGM